MYISNYNNQNHSQTQSFKAFSGRMKSVVQAANVTETKANALMSEVVEIIRGRTNYNTDDFVSEFQSIPPRHVENFLTLLDLVDRHISDDAHTTLQRTIPPLGKYEFPQERDNLAKAIKMYGSHSDRVEKGSSGIADADDYRLRSTFIPVQEYRESYRLCKIIKRINNDFLPAYQYDYQILARDLRDFSNDVLETMREMGLSERDITLALPVGTLENKKFTPAMLKNYPDYLQTFLSQKNQMEAFYREPIDAFHFRSKWEDLLDEASVNKGRNSRQQKARPVAEPTTSTDQWVF